jgi:hypothetical protein
LNPPDLFVHLAKRKTLKVDSLLAQYLYQNKMLSLPGIGTFTFEGTPAPPDENSKNKIPLEGISYSSKSSPLPDENLIEYIKLHTGKMRPLAISDLESYIALGQQFLNIGKPFFLEGIGTLQKNKDGSFSFNAGTAYPIKIEDGPDKHHELSRKSVFLNEGKGSEEEKGRDYRKFFLAAGILGTLVVIGWGGYYLYNKNRNVNEPETNALRVVADSQTTRNIRPDTATLRNPVQDSSKPSPDSAKTVPAPPVQVSSIPNTKPPEGAYKFVFETTTNKSRALKRYGYLKTFSRVKMETRDSVTFKIFMILKRLPSDTAWAKDSLNNWYYGKKPIKVTIE